MNVIFRDYFLVFYIWENIFHAFLFIVTFSLSSNPFKNFFANEQKGNESGHFLYMDVAQSMKTIFQKVPTFNSIRSSNFSWFKQQKYAYPIGWKFGRIYCKIRRYLLRIDKKPLLNYLNILYIDKVYIKL